MVYHETRKTFTALEVQFFSKSPFGDLLSQKGRHTVEYYRKERTADHFETKMAAS